MQDTVLYEEFLEARRVAIDLTDTFQSVAAGDPRRELLWQQVIRQTETARRLLDTWLRTPPLPIESDPLPTWMSVLREAMGLDDERDAVDNQVADKRRVGV